MTLRADPALAELCAGRFQGKPPTGQVEGGTVRINLHHKRLQLRMYTADLTLNPAVPWDVDSSGVWRLRADLRSLLLGSFVASGGAADMTLLLPSPKATVPVRVSGGAHKLTIRRRAWQPGSAWAPVYIGSRWNTLHLGSASGETRWETPDFEAASFDTSQEAEDEPAGTPVPAGTAGAAGSRWAEALSPEEYPTLAPLAGRLADPDPDARFEFGLQVLLDGLELRLASG